MEDVLISRWKAAATALLDTLEDNPVDVGAGGTVMKMENSVRWTLEAFAQAGVEEWQAVSPHVLRRYRLGSNFAYNRQEECDRIKSLRYGLAAIQGDVEAVPRHERDFVAHVLG